MRSINKNKSFVVIISLIAFLSITASLVMGLNSSSNPQPANTPSNAVTDGLQISIEKSNTGSLELWIDPQDDSYHINTLTLSITLSSPESSLLTTSSTLSFSDAFSPQNNWKYPFITFSKSAENGLTLDFSALYSSPKPFVLNQKTLIAILPIRPLNKVNAIQVSMNTEVSKAFTKNNQTMPIILTTSNVSME